MINAFNALYDHRQCRVAVKEGSCAGFAMTSGVRQGCPLPPLMYAAVAKALLDKLEAEIPDIMARAYADDTAVVVRRFWEEAPRMAEIFKEFALISGLRLNKSKSIILPLGHSDLPEFTLRKLGEVPRWADIPVQRSCKYLGYFMGPGKGDSSWRETYKKYMKRVGMWQDQPLGLFWDARAYNVFTITVLGYVALQEAPPDWVLNGIKASLSKVAKRPNEWASKEDLWTLKESFWLQESFRKLSRVALASHATVCTLDKACKPRHQFHESCAMVRTAFGSTAQLHTRLQWIDWSSRAFCLRLAIAESEINRLSGSIEALRNARLQCQCHIDQDVTWTKDCQKTLYAFLVACNIQDPIERMRHKQARWKLGDHSRYVVLYGSVRQRTPTWQAEHGRWRLTPLKTLVAPRVRSAVFGVIWNRWRTARRFQGEGCCLFGCNATRDQYTAEHYCGCLVVREIYRRRPNLDPNTFSNFHSFLLVNPMITTRETLITVALMVYAVHTATDRLRHEARRWKRLCKRSERVFGGTLAPAEY